MGLGCRKAIDGIAHKVAVGGQERVVGPGRLHIRGARKQICKCDTGCGQLGPRTLFGQTLGEEDAGIVPSDQRDLLKALGELLGSGPILS